MQDYEVRFTKLAQEFAKAKSSLAAVEERVRGEIADWMQRDDGFKRLDDLIMHVVEMGDAGEYVCYPAGENLLEIDTVSYDEKVLDKGPLKGKTVMLPRRDSEDRDD